MFRSCPMSSFQTDRFRCVYLYSRRKDVSVEQFQRAIQVMLDAYDEVPVIQRNRLNREVCLPTSNVVQGMNFSTSQSSFDALVILDFESKEKFDEMCRDPKVIEVNLSSQRDGIEPANFMLSQKISVKAQRRV
ncbi:hypothetical protein C8R43DRAFT_1244006 [Mycena crocata]|nr:hypothetical protein C8R43DRAFT_1244006 [Mycena crocata]